MSSDSIKILTDTAKQLHEEGYAVVIMYAKPGDNERGFDVHASSLEQGVSLFEGNVMVQREIMKRLVNISSRKKGNQNELN